MAIGQFRMRRVVLLMLILTEARLPGFCRQVLVVGAII